MDKEYKVYEKFYDFVTKDVKKAATLEATLSQSELLSILSRCKSLHKLHNDSELPLLKSLMIELEVYVLQIEEKIHET